MKLGQEVLEALARRGAASRLEELRQEIAALESLVGSPTPVRAYRKRSGMSAKARKAVSERMRIYWAARRKADKKAAPAARG